MLRDLGDKKRMKRSENFNHHEDSEVSDDGSRTSPSKDVDDHSDIEIDYGFEYDFITPPTTLSSRDPAKSNNQTENPLASTIPEQSPDPKDPQHEDEDGETTYQFRLFSAHPSSGLSKSTADAATPVAAAASKDTIRLSATPPPSADNLNLIDNISLHKTQFLRPRRPDSYYFTSALPTSTLSRLSSQYSETALSTTDILTRAKSTKWPGTSLPWRVIHVKLAQPTKTPTPTTTSRSSTQPSSSSRPQRINPRPSKKRRLVLRRRSAAQADLVEKAKAADEAEREKRTRRNREKKVKRKEREKRKKQDAAAASLGTETQPVGEDSADESMMS
ncbi:hypothetical protein PV10_04408 [Exophiala mesophila]|uniref:Uncharacterized protein n=1 Tax=Exophiala mesophila TaxID=212818 RepID=A0A0D1XY57_EXOME|nr:uncharacterized protein PV10_04408 [Exophiala mesophila]KIV93171.1 hypothetical protein PV10_04408 [Exophiala mesophila]